MPGKQHIVQGDVKGNKTLPVPSVQAALHSERIKNALDQREGISLQPSGYGTQLGRTKDGFVWLYWRHLLCLISINPEKNQWMGNQPRCPAPTEGL